MSLDQETVALAAAHGVATWYEDSSRHRIDVGRQVVVDVLGLLGVDATTPAAVAAGLAAVRDARQSDRLPPTIVITAGERRALPAPGEVMCEDGAVRTTTAELSGAQLSGAQPSEHLLPGDLPLGWHRLTCAGQDITLVVVPSELPLPPATWGWMLQLYALRSAQSWGMGDLGDLSTFTREAGAGGAGFVLLNPLHAVPPTLPVQASPYSPSSRRFTNPLYLRVTDTPAYRDADADLRRRVDMLRPDDRVAAGATIDYDAVWQAKRDALELLFPLAGAVVEGDAEVIGFATYCAIAETHGPNWRSWPEPLRAADGPAAAEIRETRADRVAFHCWLQLLCQEQLGTVAEAAAAAGMPIGIVHDLAVGVDPGGADAWVLADVIAEGVRVGAPPDSFNQLGQDWGLAAWHPARLAETGYAAYRDLLRRTLSHGGGIRVDHVAGLSRLWWIPANADATRGTYVSYDADAMLGILALEAHRAGAIVVGEDLGTVSPAVTEGLQKRNMLGSTVLWFARDAPEGAAPAPFTPPARWPANALASISTHDLPTAYGLLAGEHVRVRAKLGLLAHDIAVEQAGADADRAALSDMLAAFDPAESDAGSAADDDHATVVRMHRVLAASPSRLVAASLYDVLGELRQPNMPGTVDEYPNWRLPLPLPLEAIFDDPRVTEISEMLSATRASARIGC